MSASVVMPETMAAGRGISNGPLALRGKSTGKPHLHNACPIPYDGSIPEAGGSLMGDKSPKNTAKSKKQKTMKAQTTPKPTTSPVKK